MHLRFLLTLLSVLVLNADPAPDDPAKDDPSKDKKDGKPEGVTDEIQKWMSGIVAKESRAAAKKARDDRDAELEEQRKKDEAEAQRKKDEASGEFEKVKQSLESDAKTAGEERDRYKGENETLLKLVKADVDAAWNDLPEEVREAYDGEDDDVLAKKQHMQRMAKVIAKLTGGPSGPRGNGPNPKPTDPKINHQDEVEKARRKNRVI